MNLEPDPENMVVGSRYASTKRQAMAPGVANCLNKTIVHNLNEPWLVYSCPTVGLKSVIVVVYLG